MTAAALPPMVTVETRPSSSGAEKGRGPLHLRIGDRAVNMAERVIFMVTGQYTEVLEDYD